jgi:hypothetical protein
MIQDRLLPHRRENGLPLQRAKSPMFLSFHSCWSLALRLAGD